MQPMPATYDERDGFGDFINYRERSLGVIGASTAGHALKLMSGLCPAELQNSMKAVLVA